MPRIARVTAAAAVVLAAAGLLSGVLIDERSGLVGALETVLRTIVVAAAAIAVAGGFVLIARAGRGVRRGPVGWAAAVAGVAAFAWFVAIPIGFGVYLTHLPGRRAVHDVDLGRPKEPVALTAADGATVRGWYVPSRNGAAVIALHGTGSNRLGVADHARMLGRHGYGVLALDLRGHGDSDGRSTSLPWKLDDDLDGAIAWLARRPDVEPRRIGALGVSLGGEVAIQAAARRRELRAIVAEGANGIAADARRGGTDPASAAQLGILGAVSSVLGGEGPPASDGELLERIAPRPVLLISAGRDEDKINRAYVRQAGGALQHWNLRGASHAAGLRTDRAGYERRVTGFLDRALLG
jgi:pimeloyl-ACP methyl ester carboxylesterase